MKYAPWSGRTTSGWFGPRADGISTSAGPSSGADGRTGADPGDGAGGANPGGGAGAGTNPPGGGGAAGTPGRGSVANWADAVEPLNAPANPHPSTSARRMASPFRPTRTVSRERAGSYPRPPGGARGKCRN